MKYPFKYRPAVSSTYKEHLDDPSRCGFPGIDLVYNYGDEIGAITKATLDYWYDDKLGNTAVLMYEHNGEYYRWDFCHLSYTLSSPNNALTVEEGHLIARSGNTGNVWTYDENTQNWRPVTEDERNKGLGTHVHTSLRINGKFVDPTPYLDELWDMQFSKQIEAEKESIHQAEINHYQEQLAKLSADLAAATQAKTEAEKREQLLTSKLQEKVSKAPTEALGGLVLSGVTKQAVTVEDKTTIKKATNLVVQNTIVKFHDLINKLPKWLRPMVYMFLGIAFVVGNIYLTMPDLPLLINHPVFQSILTSLTSMGIISWIAYMFNEFGKSFKKEALESLMDQ